MARRYYRLLANKKPRQQQTAAVHEAAPSKAAAAAAEAANGNPLLEMLSDQLLVCILSAGEGRAEGEIARGVLRSKDLGRAMVVCTRFTPALANQAAQSLVARWPRHDRCPDLPGQSQLDQLRELERLDTPLRFSMHQIFLECYDSSTGTRARGASSHIRVPEAWRLGPSGKRRRPLANVMDIGGEAWASLHPMRAGVHHVNFTIEHCLGPGGGDIAIGLGRVAAKDDPNDDRATWDTDRQRHREFNGDQHFWMLRCRDGKLAVRNQGHWRESQATILEWPGQQGFGTGDVVGLRLDLDRSTLTAFKNGLRLGVVRMKAAYHRTHLRSVQHAATGAFCADVWPCCAGCQWVREGYTKFTCSARILLLEGPCQLPWVRRRNRMGRAQLGGSGSRGCDA
jgi:hypothetical protein